MKQHCVNVLLNQPERPRFYLKARWGNWSQRSTELAFRIIIDVLPECLHTPHLPFQYLGGRK